MTSGQRPEGEESAVLADGRRNSIPGRRDCWWSRPMLGMTEKELEG